MAVTPMNLPTFTSSSDALTSAITRAGSTSFTLTMSPLRNLMSRTSPSTFSIWPRMRTGGGCWAKLADVASSRAKAATPKTPRVIWFMSSSQNSCTPPIQDGARRNANVPCTLVHLCTASGVAANSDVGCLQRSVRLLLCGEDEDLDPRLEVALVAWLGSNDRRVRRNDDFLLLVLVLHSQHLAVDPGDCLRDRGIRHRALRPRIPRPVPLAGSALSLRENHHLDRALITVSLRHGRDRDVTIHFDFGERHLDRN